MIGFLSHCMLRLIASSTSRRLADDTAFMSAGRVWEHTPTQQFFRQPGSQATRLFIQGELPWRMEP